jgi:hypothetical protein
MRRPTLAIACTTILGGHPKPAINRRHRSAGPPPAISVEVSTDSGPPKPATKAEVSTDSARGPRPGRAPSASACEPYRELIAEALERGRNAMAIWQDLLEVAVVDAFERAVREHLLTKTGN